MDLARAAAELLASSSRSFAVRLWDGSILPPERPLGAVSGCVAFTTPRAFDALLPPVSERRLAEAVLDGDIDLEGDVIGLLEAAGTWEGPTLSASLAPALVSMALRRGLSRSGPSALAARVSGRIHSMARDRKAVRHHYDLSDEFYRLFLDQSMVYSCAYFKTGSESLDQAQQDKLDLICRKLALARGDRLLDVGCGWGALLEHAAKHYAIEGIGITLSDNQLAEARRRLARARADGRVSALGADYRLLPPMQQFHKVASVGMMEHVGRARLEQYFATIHRHMHPGGLFLNHAIADISFDTTTLPWTRRRGGGFIARYIFPDGDLVPLGTVVAVAERAGFEVRDVESLREHYAETLAVWLKRLEARFTDAEALVGSRRARAYRLYLASSAAAFRLGRISVFQLLLAKRSGAGRAEAVPRCRAEWYGPAAGTPQASEAILERGALGRESVEGDSH